LAFTVGRHIAFRAGEYLPQSDKRRRLLAHELAHVAQQRRTGFTAAQLPFIQRQASSDQDGGVRDSLTAPFSEKEWRSLYFWLSRGEVGIDPLTDDPDHNANLVAGAIFCERRLSISGLGEGEDPLLCVLPDVTAADPRVQTLKQEVSARGPIIHWPAVGTENRLVYVMNLLVDTYQYPPNGAAGIVGNLLAESGVIPSRIEGGSPVTPMRAANQAGSATDFTPEEVMNRDIQAGVGPQRPGIGLAQWTHPSRRAGLFQRNVGGRQLGSSILFDMDAQVEYLVSELQARAGLNARLTAPGVSLNDASDDILYLFEIPRSILDAVGNKLPRNDPAVQAVFARRRANGQSALQAHQAAYGP
jgi:hypothetical protein